MTNGFLKGCAIWLCSAGVALATDPIYINTGSIEPGPRVDATAFVNEGTFSIPNSFIYDTQNTLYYTNRNSGFMTANLGFEFKYFTDTNAQPASTFINEGEVFGNTYVLVTATNIQSSGLFRAGSAGIVRLDGDTVNLSRGALQTGGISARNGASSFPSGAFSTVSGNGADATYTTENDITELYAGVGDNGAFQSTGGGTQNTFNDPQDVSALKSPVPRTQGFQMITETTGLTNTFQLPQFGGNYTAFAFTNMVSPTNIMVQVVFVSTNNGDTNFEVDVKFAPPTGRADFPDGKVATVRLGLRDIDPISGQYFTNNAYFVDRSATTTNFALITNRFNTNFYRPFPYVFTRRIPTEYATGTTNNTVFTNTLLSDASFSNRFVTNHYAGYSASVTDGAASSSGSTSVFVNLGNFVFIGSSAIFTDPAKTDPTNQPGRIEVNARYLDMDNLRLRSQGIVKVKADQYAGNAPAVIDAPDISYELGTTNKDLVVRNLLKDTVTRFSGTITAWTGFWTNQTGTIVTNSDTNMPTVTNVIDIVTTVLVLDHSFQTIVPVQMSDLFLHGKNVELADNYTLVRNFSIDADTMTVDKNLQFSGTLSNWVTTNFSRVSYFTNLGSVTVPSLINFGGDRSGAMSNVVNRGSMSSGAQIYKSDTIENAGSMRATTGPITMTSTAIKLDASSTRAQGDVRLTANSLKVRNSVVSAGSASTNGNGLISYQRAGLQLNVSDSISDGGVGASNRWTVYDGFKLLSRPKQGDLLGTEIRSVAPSFAQVQHVWAAEDKGDSAAAFENNTPVGRLVLDGNNNCLFVFSGAVSNSAMYVDYLELRNFATNINNLLIQPGITVYFAAANVPVEQLDGKFNGRLKWAKSFAGPNSTTNITLASGGKLSVNVSLFNSQTVDSDGDGLVNANDPSPFDGVVISKVIVTNLPPPTALISWSAAAQTTYNVEYVTNLLSTNWLSLLSVSNPASSNAVLTVQDPLVPDSPQRYYRVRYAP